MKVIDLLNKIANGEEVPEKFKFAGQIFEKQGSYIEDEDGDSIFKSMFTDFSNINDEVEIIEKDKPFNKKVEEIYNRHIDYIYDKEDKKIRKLPKEVRQPNNFEEVVYIAEDLVNKINEIIDYINKEK